jgi:hypothetical protein
MTRISLQTINHVSEKWHWKGSMGRMFKLLQEIEDLILPYKRHQPEVTLCTVCRYVQGAWQSPIHEGANWKTTFSNPIH